MLSGVWLPLAALHQLGALVLFGAALYLVYALHTKARAAADINTAALQAAKAIHGRHGGIAEAVAVSPAPMAATAFYPS